MSGKPVTAEAVLKYHRVNDVQKFCFSRPAPKKDVSLIASNSQLNFEKYNDNNDIEMDSDCKVTDYISTTNANNSNNNNNKDNEFASLWLERTVLTTSNPLPGILRWFPVISNETYLVSPLRNAVETMQIANSKLRNLIITYKSDLSLPLNPLSMKLNGILDPAVMGGIDNYEKAFLNHTYKETHPQECSDLLKLENLIAEQIPLLGVGVTLHKSRAPPQLTLFHQRLEQCFHSMKTEVEKKYGKRTCDLQIDALTQSVTMRKDQHYKNNIYCISDISTSMNTLESSSVRSHILSSTSLQKALGSGVGTNKKKDSKRRHSRKSEIDCKEQSTSQWYTTPELSIQSLSSSNSSTLNITCTPVFELRQELTSSRPLRSEIERERRLSSRWSGQSQTYSLKNINGYDTSDARIRNRDSIATTDSNASEDDLPPPLPLKMRDSDCNNLPQEQNLSDPNHNKCKNELESQFLDCLNKPPTPPPKPSRPFHIVSNRAVQISNEHTLQNSTV